MVRSDHVGVQTIPVILDKKYLIEKLNENCKRKLKNYK